MSPSKSGSFQSGKAERDEALIFFWVHHEIDTFCDGRAYRVDYRCNVGGNLCYARIFFRARSSSSRLGRFLYWRAGRRNLRPIQDL